MTKLTPRWIRQTARFPYHALSSRKPHVALQIRGRITCARDYLGLEPDRWPVVDWEHGKWLSRTESIVNVYHSVIFAFFTRAEVLLLFEIENVLHLIIRSAGVPLPLLAVGVLSISF